MELIEQLYEENHRELYNYLLRLTGDSLLSEDLLSETFLQAIRSIPSFRGDSSIKTWLFGVARNCWLQYLRKEDRKSTRLNSSHSDRSRMPSSA